MFRLALEPGAPLDVAGFGHGRRALDVPRHRDGRRLRRDPRAVGPAVRCPGDAPPRRPRRRSGATAGWSGSVTTRSRSAPPSVTDLRSRGSSARFGGGMHSVAVQVADLAATLDRLEPLGVEVASRIGPEIVFTRPGRDRGPRARVGEPRAGRRSAMGCTAAALRDAAGRRGRTHGVRRRARERSGRRRPSARRRASTPRGSSTATPATSGRMSLRPRSIWATACSRCTRSRRTRRRVTRCGVDTTTVRAASRWRCRSPIRPWPNVRSRPKVSAYTVAGPTGVPSSTPRCCRSPSCSPSSLLPGDPRVTRSQED